MGLEDDGYAAAAEGGKTGSSIPCSICLDDVTDYGDRAWAKLHCGHQFHLDCIGSAFNVKGVMQCPNCRKIEKGQWLYADGGRPYPELNIDDLVNDEDLYDLSYSESSMWCPYGGYAHLSAAFDEVEFPTTAYHDIGSEHATSVSSSATHICPYIAYVHPSTENVTQQGARFDSNNNQWNTQSASSETPNSYPLHYHTTLFPTLTTRIHDDDLQHPSISMPRRQRANADLSVSPSGSYPHPFLAAQSSGTRPASSSMNRGYPGTGSGGQSHAYFQQPQRSNGQVQVSDRTHGGVGGGVYYSGSSTGRGFQETERSMLNFLHHIWERDLPHQRPVSADRVLFHQAAGGGFRQRSERMPSESRYWS
ncbi:unnamed protein product [Lactuca saligna]|uniref:RING-type domain-containing protein n=1 Tax=Lactuca saligna TaxID=75948 RepID=A0AA35VFN3_LACSI|nr:unnamed protein product [Lactuca saligna]